MLTTEGTKQGDHMARKVEFSDLKKFFLKPNGAKDHEKEVPAKLSEPNSNASWYVGLGQFPYPLWYVATQLIVLTNIQWDMFVSTISNLGFLFRHFTILVFVKCLTGLQITNADAEEDK